MSAKKTFPPQHAADGKNIRSMRTEMGMTQATFCKVIGVSLTTLWRLEKGHEKPSKTLVKLLEVITDNNNSAYDIKNS